MPYPTDGNNNSLFPRLKASPVTVPVNAFGDQPPGILNGNSKPMKTEPTRHSNADPHLSTSPQARGNADPNLSIRLKMPRTKYGSE